MIHEIAETVQGRKKQMRTQGWFDEDFRRNIEDRNEARKIILHMRTEERIPNQSSFL